MWVEMTLRLIFTEVRLTYEFLFYETIVLTFELAIQKRLRRKKRDSILEEIGDIL